VGIAFIIGAGLAEAGWGSAGIWLYPATHPPNQVFLAFVLGGMMLGGAAILAARPEAFLAFLVPMGLATSLRFFVQGDDEHLAMDRWPSCLLSPRCSRPPGFIGRSTQHCACDLRTETS
jgi:hypothetical protein